MCLYVLGCRRHPGFPAGQQRPGCQLKEINFSSGKFKLTFFQNIISHHFYQSILIVLPHVEQFASRNKETQFYCIFS